MIEIVSSDKYTGESVVFFGDFLQSERKTAICPIMHLTPILAIGKESVSGTRNFWFSMCFLAESVYSRDTCASLEASLCRQGLTVNKIKYFLPDRDPHEKTNMAQRSRSSRFKFVSQKIL